MKGKHLHDIYAIRQAEKRKQANLSRQTVIRERTAEKLGDPIRGVPTPFVKSFDYDIPRDAGESVESGKLSVEAAMSNPDQAPPSSADASSERHLRFGLAHEELADAIKTSRMLTETMQPADRRIPDPMRDAADLQDWKTRDKAATEAVNRITSLANANSRQRSKRNTERVVETFGRHNTDLSLRPRAPTVNAERELAPIPRVGPDTGSSEVQIGILTAKIRVLADKYEGEGRSDKINKRNLRLLLHRRQKLLKYMERKERGSERWFHMIETLGLTPATWRGEIEVQ